MNVDCCHVCTDPLEWTAVGECGHKDVCSRCVARWRFVVQDFHCMVCKQQLDKVFFTRFMGDYTARLAPEQFAELEPKAKRGELYQLKEIGGYFDDVQHYQLIQSLCGYTHPYITDKCAEEGREVPTFTSTQALKRFVETNYKYHFCDICMKGRKVFMCEQLLYDKPGLEKHMRQGDESGPLADTSFKGHPLCKFCHKRFYDSNELYKHMEHDHWHCHLCRRANPGQYVYYKNYDELEDHFRQAHHPCTHESCLEKKFVVFASEHELNRHIASEHGDELKMTRAQRREAMTIPVNLQYRDVRDGATTSTAPRLDERPGVVIGGGHNAERRLGRQGNQAAGNQGMRHSRSTGEVQAALQASLQQQREEPAPDSITFSADDFPSVSGSSNMPMTGLWVGAIPGHGAGGSGGNRGAFEEHFPALPTMTKAERKRLKNQQQSLAEQLRAANMPVRVLNASRYVISTPAAGSSSRSGQSSTSGTMQHSLSASALAGPSSAAQEVPAADAFPALASRPNAPTSAAPPASTPAFAAAAIRSPGPKPMASNLSKPPAAAPSMTPADFPSLPASAPTPVSAPPPAMPPRYTAAASVLLAGGSNPGSSSMQAVPAPAPVQLQDSDFPSLPAPASNKKKPGAKAGKAAKPSSNTSPAAASAVATPSSPTPASSNGGSGVSSTLVQANKQLIAKIQAQLNDESQFAKFRSESGQFARGEISASEYHKKVLQLGLMQLVPELAATCPQAERCDALLAAHTAFLASPEAQDPATVGQGWVPPEAAAAALAEVQSRWACSRCTLRNAPDAVACEACGALQPGLAQPGSTVDAFPSLSSAYGGASSSATTSSSSSSATAAPLSTPVNGHGNAEEAGSSDSGKKKKGGTKITIGLGAGMGRAASSSSPAAWGGPASVAAASNLGAKAPKQPNMWSKGGGDKIARQYNAVNEAWGSQ